MVMTTMLLLTVVVVITVMAVMMMVMMTVMVRMMELVVVVVTIPPPPLSSLPLPCMHVLNGYPVPGISWALAIDTACQGWSSPWPRGAHAPAEKRAKRGNGILSESDKDWEGNERRLRRRRRTQ